MAVRNSDVRRRKRTLTFLLFDPSSVGEHDNMIKTTPEQNKTLVLQRSIRFSTSGTTRPPSGTGHRTTFNTARTSRLGATACSISLGARRRR
jgi:hypothetical protein